MWALNSWDSMVSIAPIPLAGIPILVGTKIFLAFKNIHTVSGAHQTFNFRSTWFPSTDYGGQGVK